MLCFQGVQKIGLHVFNHKLKSALECTVRSQCTPIPDRRTDGQTDEHRGNSATIGSKFSNERIVRYKK